MIAGQGTVYVANHPACLTAPGGCDGSQSKPLPSIKAGIAKLGPGGGLILLNPDTYSGPDNTGLVISGTSIAIRNTATFSTIDCKNNGKRAFTVQNGNFVMQKVFVTNCGSATTDGGAISLQSASMTLLSLGLDNNKGKRGGAIFINQASAVLSGVSFRGNTASSGGGGLFFQNANVDFGRADFANNTPNDLQCNQGSATNRDSTLGKVKCTSCNIPLASGGSACPA